MSMCRARRTVYLLMMLLALCLLGGGFGTAALVWADYRDSRAEALAQTRQHVRLAEEALLRRLAAADAPEATLAGLDLDGLRQYLGEEGDGAPHYALLRLDGSVLAVSGGGEGGRLRHLLDGLGLSLDQPAPVAVGAEGRLFFLAKRRLGEQKAQIVVATRSNTVLAPWRGRTFATVGTAALMLALVAALSALLVQEMRRERRSSASLEQANRELRRSNADLEQFAYVASHDLKEPLRNIASYVQLLQRRYEGRLDEDADAFIGYTVEGVRRLQRIINELLVYSRIGTGPLARGPVQTGIVLSNVLGNLKATIAEAGAAVEVKGPLPVVLGDGGQLSSVFQNLIANGLKYRRDDVRPEITVSVAEAGRFWRFSVADNGIGIEPSYHQQIFELFKRLHGRDRYGGTGIGLAVCQRVIERHGGEIWVESQPGVGSTFVFTLPKG